MDICAFNLEIKGKTMEKSNNAGKVKNHRYRAFLHKAVDMKRLLLFWFFALGTILHCSYALAVLPQISAGYRHTLALHNDATVWAWGQNYYGQLGDSSITERYIPAQVSGLANMNAIAAGGFFSMALKDDGTVLTWGDNYYGQLGDGTTDSHSTPAQVSGLTNVTAIEAGFQHGAALKDDNTVWAWGDNFYGQLGDGTTDGHFTPVQVSGLTNVIDIVAGDNHTLALKNDGTVWAWGNNAYGQLGDGTTDDSSIPVQVSGLTNIIAIAAGWVNSMAIKNDGSVWAWGDNSYGQLGNGTTDNSSTPVQVSGLTNATDIAIGDYHGVAIMADGSVWTWGGNDFGQLGNASTTSSSVPVQVTSLPTLNMTDITAGGYQTLTLQDDGTVWAWGYNFWGQLGDGTFYDRIAPVQSSGLNLFSSGLQQTYSITTSVVSSGYIAPGSVVVASGTNMTFTIIPSADYEIAMVLVDGNYVGTVNSYTFTNVTGPHEISAYFVPIIPTCYAEPVKLGTQGLYSTIQEAYNVIGAGSAETIYSQDVFLGDSLTLDRDVAVTLKGGYDCYFNEPPLGQTVLDIPGPLIIKSGTGIFENIIIR